MIRNGFCTVYHWNDETEKHERKIYRSNNFVAHSIEAKKGFDYANKMTTRIPRAGNPPEIEVECGDKVLPRQCFDDEPPADCFKVLEVRDNKYGYNPHIRLEAAR